MLTRGCVLSIGVIALTLSGCSGALAYKGAEYDVMRLSNGVYGSQPKLPAIRAHFCLRRAVYNRDTAAQNSFWDTLMLVAAGVSAGGGAAVGATTAVMDESSTKKDYQIAGAGALAIGGAILALRTTLALNELARAQRIAAANDVDTAIDILERYALGDDPKDVGADGFDACRDEEINVARAFPGARSAADVEKQAAGAQEQKTDADAEVAKAEAANVEATEAVRLRSLDLKRADEARKALPEKDRDTDQAAAEAKEVDKAAAKKKATEEELKAAKRNAAQANVAVKRAAFVMATYYFRRAVFYGTQSDVGHASELVVQARKDLDAARSELAGLAENKPAETKPPETKTP